MSCFSLKGRLKARCEPGILLSFELRSFNGNGMLSVCVVAECLLDRGSGIRLEPCPFCVSVEPYETGIVCPWEPSDPGCEIQSSDNESSQAFSIVDRFGNLVSKRLRDKLLVYDIAAGLFIVVGCADSRVCCAL